MRVLSEKPKMAELKIMNCTQSGLKVTRSDVFFSVRGVKLDGGFSETKSIDVGKLSIAVVSYLDRFNQRRYKLQLVNNYPYPISVTCPIFYITKENLYPGCRHISSGFCHGSIFDDCNQSVTFNIKIEKLPSVRNPSNFQTSLYKDTDMTDFELCAEGGSVKVHKVVLAVSSPVFKAMLTSDWKEASEGRVELAETSKETLEYFKKYVYVHTIDNDIGCENLLQLHRLASFYMMPDMEQDCLVRIQEHISGKNIWSLMNAVTHTKNGKLLVAILRHINEETISAIEKEICEPEESVTE